MSTVRRFRPENRLKAKLAAPGGKLVSDALAHAESRLDSISGPVLAAIDQKILAIEALTLAGARGEAPDAPEQIYATSNEIFAEAGAFGRKALSEAAHSLCTLLSRSSESVPWPSVTVHVQTMRILRQQHVESSDTMCQAVLEGLRKVSAR